MKCSEVACGRQAEERTVGRPIDVGFLVFSGEGLNERHVLPGERLTDLAVDAERVGFDSVGVIDHLRWEIDGRPHGFRECTTLLAAFAAVTSRLRLGSAVLNTPFRNPALIAKIALTIDEISGGRFTLGLGAGGGPEVEYESYGFAADHRYSRFEEALQIIHSLLRQGSVDFHGTYHRAAKCILTPGGPRPGRTPIMIGGEGPKVMRLAARYADEWNHLTFGTPTPQSFLPFLARLDEACGLVGRDPTAIRRTVDIIAAPTEVVDHGLPNFGIPIHGRPDHMARQLAAFAEVGIAETRLYLWPQTRETVAAMEPVLAALDQLG
jgi:alkanesulfonate monooxygenase SsuD/methylene tetrahydromethanopterin reductase-like flavin-dependent oxidoreductase (luciferase family)